MERPGDRTVGFYHGNETETLEVLEYFAGTRKELPYGEYTTGHEKRGVE